MIPKQRHLGRELALRWLFQIDMGHLPPDEVLSTPLDELEETFERLEGIEAEGEEFALQLVRGIISERQRIDEMIMKYAKGWPLERIAGVDRNVLRIAIYEILDVADIPPSVSVNEAVDIAKHYSTDESGKFVNGILGAFLRGEFGPPEQA
ncbi:MAG: transcription antitermination factor NusB [Armatimonadota bacterium]